MGKCRVARCIPLAGIWVILPKIDIVRDRILLIPLLWFQVICCSGQAGEDPARPFLLRTIAFYNLENLFDTSNDSLAHDDAHTPAGSYGWTKKRLDKKLDHLAQVLGDIGKEYQANPPDLIGVCEVENRTLLEQLVSRSPLRAYPFGIIHYDSPDPRGIDVALLYRKDRFFPLDHGSFRLLIHNEVGRRKYTRDQLVVSGYLDQDQIIVLINHWPSRGGNSIQSREYRKAAALRQRGLIDSLFNRLPDAKIIVMGDFNDNPTDPSMKMLSGRQQKVGHGLPRNLFNPMTAYFRKGMGSLAYRDRWNLFDQILLSPSLMNPAPNSYRFWKAGVFRPDYLKNKEGRYKGYPLRTYAGGTYQEGFSDHFPVYAYLIRSAVPESN